MEQKCQKSERPKQKQHKRLEHSVKSHHRAFDWNWRHSWTENLLFYTTTLGNCGAFLRSNVQLCAEMRTCSKQLFYKKDKRQKEKMFSFKEESDSY